MSNTASRYGYDNITREDGNILEKKKKNRLQIFDRLNEAAGACVQRPREKKYKQKKKTPKIESNPKSSSRLLNRRIRALYSYKSIIPVRLILISVLL